MAFIWRAFSACAAEPPSERAPEAAPPAAGPASLSHSACTLPVWLPRVPRSAWGRRASLVRAPPFPLLGTHAVVSLLPVAPARRACTRVALRAGTVLEGAVPGCRRAARTRKGAALPRLRSVLPRLSVCLGTGRRAPHALSDPHTRGCGKDGSCTGLRTCSDAGLCGCGCCRAGAGSEAARCQTARKTLMHTDAPHADAAQYHRFVSLIGERCAGAEAFYQWSGDRHTTQRPPRSRKQLGSDCSVLALHDSSTARKG